MLAVLEDAIECFQKYADAHDGKRERSFLEAEEWILERDSDWPFSFENICNVFDLDPNYIRRGLMRKQQFLNEALKAKCRFMSKQLRS